MTRWMTRTCRMLMPALLCLAGCSSLPTSGPSNSQVLDQAVSENNPLGIRIVDLSPATIDTLRSRPERSLSVIDRLRSKSFVRYF